MSALGPIALALFAGIVSFTSPCCLPLMPGYLAYVGGVAEGAGQGATVVAVRRRVVGASSSPRTKSRLYWIGSSDRVPSRSTRWTT